MSGYPLLPGRVGQYREFDQKEAGQNPNFHSHKLSGVGEM